MFENGRKALEDLLGGNRGIYSDGGFVSGEGEPIDIVSPSTGETLGTLSQATDAQVDAAVAAARSAFATGDWARDGEQRAAILRRLADLVDERAEVIAYLDAVEAGKVFAGSVAEDVPDVVANIRFHADLISSYEGRYLQDSSGFGWVKKVPIGVVAAVLPWNFPIAMLGWKVGPALAAGNAMVIKPSEDSTLSALYFARLATEAGVPDGIVNVVTGVGATVGQALGMHPDIDVITFTGSGPSGRKVLENSAKSNLKKVSLELGGRAGYIIDDEHASDYEAIAADIAGAAFGVSGQNCTASSRVIFVGGEDRCAEFRDALAAAAAEITVGDPLEDGTDIGPVINARAHQRINSWVEEAVTKGATVVYQSPEVPQAGTWCPVTVLEGVPADSELGCGEIFGPVTQLIRVETRDEAARLINDEPYGLASTVWCEDIGQVKRWTDLIRVGTLAINGYSEGTVATPFGGMRQSGFWGRDNGPESLDTYQEAMTVWIAQS
ncbi:gamma-glutamyl-gamma-aminobutyraldehyde dehydrogenase [Brevibacterium sanguinis]|uniref:Gamma-glutamyl-gamma-aminobutyraldehyde dehydrogenase n=2 Tax=Brevibacterium TaxID=1696 RepID=A0A366IGK6_9MICO|nr:MULTISPECIES: aldehyde dehydrogenase family protein [Brevibacterium]RBP63628.1 gamma-glutamyl-gamma-aminobutyraldehyde dehydrogenase [Brevibacterium sanguinis]RBP70287.1 gamma-glutamyl-gamma-aminobutyraldehyde dehydrogenase [Brevibacterium celere]